MKSKRRSAFDPLVGHLVTESDTSSARIRNKLQGRYSWCFCELCWRTTEYTVAIDAQTVFRRMRNGYAKAIPISTAIREEAQKEANSLVDRYEKSLTEMAP
jgi:hypothetical protein